MAYQTTPAGQRRLLRRLAEARARYDALCATNGEAAEAGDNCVWHDNFAYEENQRQMHALARTVRDLENVLRAMVVVPVPRAPARVTLGTTVALRDQFGTLHRWSIAGFEDGDPEAGRISHTAPLARALLGRELGDVLAWHLSGVALDLDVETINPTLEDAQ